MSVAAGQHQQPVGGHRHHAPRIDRAAVPGQRAVDHRVAGQQVRAVQHHVGTIDVAIQGERAAVQEIRPRSGEVVVHFVSLAENQRRARFRQKQSAALAGVVKVDRAGLHIQRAAVVELRLDRRGARPARLAHHALVDHQFRAAAVVNYIIALHVHQRSRQIDQFANGPAALATAVKIQITAAV